VHLQEGANVCLWVHKLGLAKTELVGEGLVPFAFAPRVVMVMVFVDNEVMGPGALGRGRTSITGWTKRESLGG
jgi:hypothetical protein